MAGEVVLPLSAAAVMMAGSMAQIVQILTAPSPTSPMESHCAVRAVPGRGLEDDRYYLGVGTFSSPTPSPKGELTLIEAEALAAFAQESGLPFTAEHARRNVVTRGVRLNELVGHEFLLGSVLVEGLGLCEPCNYLAKQTFPETLRGLVHRGGLRARIITDGFIRVNDPVASTAP